MFMNTNKFVNDWIDVYWLTKYTKEGMCTVVTLHKLLHSTLAIQVITSKKKQLLKPACHPVATATYVWLHAVHCHCTLLVCVCCQPVHHVYPAILVHLFDSLN